MINKMHATCLAYLILLTRVWFIQLRYQQFSYAVDTTHYDRINNISCTEKSTQLLHSVNFSLADASRLSNKDMNSWAARLESWSVFPFFFVRFSLFFSVPLGNLWNNQTITYHPT